MNATNKIFSSVAVVALATIATLFTAAPAAAQLANASAITLGKSGNSTATARGMEAISVNPAGLGMPGSPGFTLSIIPIQARSGLDPITLTDLADVSGELISASTKEAWLSDIASSGGQKGSVGVDVTEVALALGKIGVQVSTIIGGQMNLSPDMVEAALFGNAGRTGSASDLSFSGATGEGWGITTAGVSFALPIASPGSDMAIGATVKYSVGHFVGAVRDQGGSFSSNPVRVDVDFPVVHTDDQRVEDSELNNGNGVGLDIGFQMKKDRISFGAAVLNAVNTFSWDESTMVYRPGTAAFTVDDSETDFDPAAYGSAPADLKAVVEDLTFLPTISVGGAYDMAEDFTVAADVRSRLGDGGIATQPKFHAGIGAEYRGLGVLHLRGGGAIITDGMQFTGGATLALGPVNLSIAGGMQTGDLGETRMGQFVLSFGGR